MSAVLLMTGISQAQGIDNNTKNKKMSTTQKNEEIVRRLFEEAMNKRDHALLKDLISEDYVGPQGGKGAEGFEKPTRPIFAAFPDIQYHIEDLFGEDDKVVVRWKLQGTHTQTFNGLEATGRKVNNDGIAIFTLKDGKVTKVQLQTDRLGFLQEMGVLPQNPAQIYAQAAASKTGIELIDKFFVPAAAKAEFYERMHINRSFIRTLPGFVKDEAYEYTDDNGNLICVTVAHWTDKTAVANAKEAVQAEYKKQGFDMPAMLKRLNITIDRAFYTPVAD
jgi:steroid delta-isomerase-like uncharacterized protein